MGVSGHRAVPLSCGNCQARALDLLFFLSYMEKLRNGLMVMSFSKLAADKNRSPYLVGHPDVKAVFKMYKCRTGLGWLPGRKYDC